MQFENFLLIFSSVLFQTVEMFFKFVNLTPKKWALKLVSRPNPKYFSRRIFTTDLSYYDFLYFDEH